MPVRPVDRGQRPWNNGLLLRMTSRPFGVKRSILLGVHSVLRGTLKLRNLSFLGSDRMDNLPKAHT